MMTELEDNLKLRQTEREAKPRPISRPDIATQDYLAEDLCEQCQLFTSGRCIRSEFRVAIDELRQLRAGSTCPFCRLLDASVPACEVPLAVSERAEFCRISGYAGQSLELNFESKTGKCFGQSRYLHPLTSLEHRGVSSEEVRKAEPPITWYKDFQTIPYRPLLPNSTDMDLVKQWLANCRDKHSSLCPKPEPEFFSLIWAFPGFRLIDCRERRIVIAPTGSEYTALSYVWGQDDDSPADCPIPCRNNLDRRLPSTLANTIEDAISVTSQLGFKYLWIDKYCIDQSANEHALLMQLSAMDLIYSGAAITIITPAGDSADSGLPGIGKRPRSGHPSVAVNGTTWFVGSSQIKAPVYTSKWNTRGWTYQEEYFSRRRLTFTDEQVLLECNTCRQCESIESEMGQRLMDGLPRSKRNLTGHIVWYTKRYFSNQADILNGIRGIFSSYSRGKTHIQQYWGIPLDPVAYGLTWYWEITPRRLRAPSAQAALYDSLAFGLTWDIIHNESRARRYGFPSWSWSGWIGPVGWPSDLWNAENDVPSRIDAVRHDGTTAILNPKLISILSNDDHQEAAMFTYLLRIKSEVLEIKFTLFEGRSSSKLVQAWQEWQTWQVYLPLNPINRYDRRPFAFAATATVNDESVTSLTERSERFWPLLLTPQLRPMDDLYQALCEQPFDCIVLGRDFGLVVRTVEGRTERIGLIRLHARLDKGHPLYGKHSYDRTAHIRDYFPGSKRTIMLG